MLGAVVALSLSFAIRQEGGGISLPQLALVKPGGKLAKRASDREMWSFGSSDIKIVPQWSGDIADFTVGTVAGTVFGYGTGRWGRWVWKSTHGVVSLQGNIAAFALSHLTAILLYTLVSCRAGFMTLNWTALIGAGATAALDKDGDGDIDMSDLKTIFNQFIGKTIQRLASKKIVSKLDADGDGDADLMDLIMWAGGNKHGSAGFFLGMLWGILKGSGIGVQAVRNKISQAKNWLTGLVHKREHEAPQKA